MNNNPKQYFTACAAIFNDSSKILLTRRNHPSNLQIHNHWQLPGGGIDFGEHPKTSVLREIFEETNLKIKLLTDQPHIYSHVFQGTQVHVVLFVYLAKYVSGTIDFSQDSEETNGADWFTLEEVKSLKSLPETATIAEEFFSLFHKLNTSLPTKTVTEDYIIQKG